MKRYSIHDLGIEAVTFYHHVKVFANSEIMYRSVNMLSDSSFNLVKSIITKLNELDLWFDSRNDNAIRTVEWAFRTISDIEWKDWLDNLDKEKID